jgi:leucyl aminopeptidase
LNLKPGDSMLTMKKDMGGAATVLGLACLVVDAKLPVRELEWPRACYLTLSVGCYSS